MSSLVSSGIFVVDSWDKGSPFAERRIAIQRVVGDWAKRIIIKTVSGADRNIPGIPQIAPQLIDHTTPAASGSKLSHGGKPMSEQTLSLIKENEARVGN